MNNIELKDLYNNLIKKPSLWAYYPLPIDFKNKRLDTFIRSIDTNLEDFESFIIKYIEISGKSRTEFVSHGLEFLKNNDTIRFKHIVSTFFLGLAIIIESNNSWKNKVYTEMRNLYHCVENKINFEREIQYIWFMLSLFHDLGYIYEKCDNENCERKYNCEELDFSNSFYKESSLVPCLYNKEVLNHYYIKRKQMLCCKGYLNDHGIVGGMIFYKELCTIREYHSKRDDKYYWGPEMEDIYKALSNIIMCHNIWFERVDKPCTHNPLQLSNYKYKTGIKKNQYKQKSYPFKFSEHPIYFLFCLVDAIEPFKILNNIEGITISISRKGINLNFSKSKEKKKKIDKYIENLLRLNEYLCPVSYKNHQIHINIT